MLCWKLSSLEVAWPARAYTALLPWWELQRILNSVAVCGKLNTWLQACTLNWLISSDSSAAQILHTHLHYQSFNLSDPALLTTMPRRKSIMETIKLKWPLNLFEEKIRSEYLVSWYRQEVCPGQSWVTSSNWTILTSSIRTFHVLWHGWVLSSPKFFDMAVAQKGLKQLLLPGFDFYLVEFPEPI